jgi:hypothetical protein
MFGQNNALLTDFDAFNPVTKEFSTNGNMTMLLPNSRSLKSLKDNVLKLKVDSLGRTGKYNIVVSNVKERKDLKQLTEDRFKSEPSTVIAMASTNVLGNPKNMIKLVVSGSSQFINNSNISRTENRDLFLNALAYLSNDKDSIAIKSIVKDDSRLNLTSPESQVALAIICFIYPMIFLAGGISIWFRRRRA